MSLTNFMRAENKPEKNFTACYKSQSKDVIFEVVNLVLFLFFKNVLML